MRTFIGLALLTGAALWAALRTPREPLQMRVLRICLFIAAGIFGALLLSAMIQALLGVG